MLKKLFPLVLSPLLVIVVVVLIPDINRALVFLPLLFALSIDFIHFNQIKIKAKLLGVFLHVLQSYLVFLGLGIALFFLDEYVQDLNRAHSDIQGFMGIVLVTAGGYFAALLLYYFLTFIFKTLSFKKSFWIISGCYVLIVLIMQIFSKNEYLQFGVEKFASFLISWIIFMSLAFSWSIQKEKIESP